MLRSMIAQTRLGTTSSTATADLCDVILFVRRYNALQVPIATEDKIMRGLRKSFCNSGSSDTTTSSSCINKIQVMQAKAGAAETALGLHTLPSFVSVWAGLGTMIHAVAQSPNFKGKTRCQVQRHSCCCPRCNCCGLYFLVAPAGLLATAAG